MQKGKISNVDGALLIALAGLTNAFSTLPGSGAGRLVWVADLFACALAVLCVFWLMKASDKYPEKNFFEVLTKTFGGVLGRVAGAALSAFSLLSFVVSLTVFSRFVQITALPQTAQMVIPLLICTTCAMALKKELYAPAGAAWLLFWFVAFVVVFSSAFSFFEISFKPMTLKAIKPLKIIIGAGEVFLNRFGFLFAIMSVYTRIKEKRQGKGSLLVSLCGVGVALSVLSATTVLMLGEKLSETDFYPIYTAISLHSAGGFIQHIEIFSCIAMTICIFFKGVICILFAEDIIMPMFRIKKKCGIAFPLALISAASTQIIYGNLSGLRGMLEWRDGAGYVVLLMIFLSAVLSAKDIKRN